MNTIAKLFAHLLRRFVAPCKYFISAPKKSFSLIVIFSIAYFFVEIRSFDLITTKHAISSYAFRLIRQDTSKPTSTFPSASQSNSKTTAASNLDKSSYKHSKNFNADINSSSQMFNDSKRLKDSQVKNLSDNFFYASVANSMIAKQYPRDRINSLQPTAFYEITRSEEVISSIEIVTSAPRNNKTLKNSEIKTFNNSLEQPDVVMPSINTLDKLKVEVNNKTEKTEPTHKATLYNYKWERKRLYKEVEEYWKDTKNSSYYTDHVTLLPKQTRSIIIVTNYRSGSSFLGQLFNQHPDAFYVFEPFYPFGNKITTYMDLKVKLLSLYLRCYFPPITHVYNHVIEPNLNLTVAIECLYNNFCFRDKMKNLCQRDYCNIPKKFCKYCGPVHLGKAMNLCRSKKMSVIKVIRFGDIMQLKPFLKDPSLNVKIIYLVRDPRGIASSRLKLHPIRIKKNMNETCQMFQYNLHNLHQIDSSNQSSWLKNRVLIVRYEDLAVNPFAVAKDIYSFSGLRFVQSVKKWIMENTKVSFPSNATAQPFTTDRNSASAMQSWRKHLSLKQIKIIQNFCSETMRYLGYRTISKQNELRNLTFRLF